MVLWIFLIGTALASKETEEEEICPICFEKLSECGTQIKTACGHKFCGNCFLENFCRRFKTQCSMCRTVLNPYVTIVESNNLPFIKEFILHYPEVLNENDGIGDSFLDIVKEKNKQDILDFMTLYIDKAPMLHGAVVNGDYEEVQKLLRQDYVNPNVIPGENNLPLSIALENDRQDIGQLLIENGAHVNQANIDCYTPLFEAVENNHISNIKFLLDNGADPNLPEYNDEYQNAILLPIWKADTVESAQLLIDYGAKIHDRLDTDGETILTNASYKGNKDLVEFYIEKGLDVNHFDENGTPLTHAIDQNHIEIAEILLKNGADPNIEHEQIQFEHEHRNHAGTLLQLCFRPKKKKRLMKALLTHCANPFVKNSVGQNTIDEVQPMKGNLATEILKKYLKNIKLKRFKREDE